MYLYIIRHGETAWNKVKRLQGQTNIPLAEEGIRLAQITGEKLMDIPFTFAITSPLQRAVQTAECVLNGRNIPIITDERIQEISFGAWEGESMLESSVLTEEFREFFFHNPEQYVCPPEGESFSDVLLRTKDFYEELIHHEKYRKAHILIATHGAAGRCLLSHFYGDGDIWRGGVPKNCAVSIIQVENGKSTILAKDKVYY